MSAKVEMLKKLPDLILRHSTLLSTTVNESQAGRVKWKSRALRCIYCSILLITLYYGYTTAATYRWLYVRKGLLRLMKIATLKAVTEGFTLEVTYLAGIRVALESATYFLLLVTTVGIPQSADEPK